MVRSVLTSAEFKLIDRLGKHGPVRPYLFGTDARGPSAKDDGALANETPGQKTTRQLLAGFEASEPRTALAESVVKVLQGKEGEDWDSPAGA